LAKEWRSSAPFWSEFRARRRADHRRQSPNLRLSLCDQIPVHGFNAGERIEPRRGMSASDLCRP